MSWDGFWRGVQFVGGAAEVAGGVVVAAGGSIFTAGVGSPAAIAGGGLLAAHGVDQMAAAWYGRDSYANQLGTAAVANVFGEEYGWLGGILGDIGPGIGGAVKGGAAGVKAIMNGVKNIPQMLGKLRSLGGSGAVRSLLGKMNPQQLKKFLGALDDDEIAKMVKNGEITDEQLRAAGLDPKKYKGGAKNSKMSVHQKAAFGEKKAHELMQKKGKRIDNGGDYKPGQNGIDGVYKNSNPPPDYTIMEAKYNKSTLGNTKDGRQMSDAWVDNRLDKAVGKVEADRIRDAMLEGTVDKVVVNVLPDGTSIVKPVDAAGKIIK